LYLGQTMKFKRPLEIGARVSVAGRVSHRSDALRVITIETTLTDAASEEVLVHGEATVRVLI
jgi:acyl dehydratase